MTHPLFSQTSQSLEIILYYDDVEVCNPFRLKGQKKQTGLVTISADS